ncbi:50S ribosome-binding GTPase family protein [Candida parapsilosis]|uniref:EngB-type G domain-containing protein n=2 Tax=Candida parapsilosis TaxID=5480 RepID=G8BFU0_CANPC|nr:uncharacterized protein CPAR2_203670 [Candida parapsilosis]KAF6055126.1 50S ribosome-binding GTPase family protein [Candida parapsilosis]KAF6055851.1 50S ribosome-binding GTPase family protein [Candida parapsilosis]KAF6058781.1 50S ribosome-binding GTPase family protein [Candida parapsilosis]KAF6067538.1 50S ribosome-binding GTPase family protein [Candida parapsilosis]KAI5901441.1 MIOREX complex component 8 [Candida parapsilosis]
MNRSPHHFCFTLRRFKHGSIDYLTKSISEVTELPRYSVTTLQTPSSNNRAHDLRKKIINPNILNDIFSDIPTKDDIAKSQRFFNNLKVELDWTLADYDEIPDVKYKRLKSMATNEHASKRTFGIKPELLKPLPEVLLMGRTNAGKSSLINNLLIPKKSLTRQEQLAYVSSKAGFTKTLNCFRLSNQLRLVDSPGYGRGGIETQGKMVLSYINNRSQLKQVLLLISSTEGIADEDLELTHYLLDRDVPLYIVFTKVDELLKKHFKRDLFKRDNAEALIKNTNQRIVELYAKLIDDSELQDGPNAPKFMFNNAQTNNILTEFAGIKTIRYNILKSCSV